MSDRRTNEELLGVAGLLPDCDCDSCATLKELARRLEAAEADTHDRILDKLLKAERFDAEHGLTLPGDSALYIEIAGMEETRGDRLRATENDTPGPVRIPNTIDTANPAGDPTIRPEEDTP